MALCPAREQLHGILLYWLINGHITQLNTDCDYFMDIFGTPFIVLRVGRNNRPTCDSEKGCFHISGADPGGGAPGARPPPPPIFRAMNIFSCKARSEVPGNRIYDVEFSNFPGGISCQAVRGFVNPGSGPVYICMISWAEPMVHRYLHI